MAFFHSVFDKVFPHSGSPLTAESSHAREHISTESIAAQAKNPNSHYPKLVEWVNYHFTHKGVQVPHWAATQIAQSQHAVAENKITGTTAHLREVATFTRLALQSGDVYAAKGAFLNFAAAGFSGAVQHAKMKVGRY